MDTSDAATSWTSKLSRMPWREVVLVVTSSAFWGVLQGWPKIFRASAARTLMSRLAGLSGWHSANYMTLAPCNAPALVLYPAAFPTTTRAELLAHMEFKNVGHLPASHPTRPFNGEFRCGVDTRINRHLDLMTAIFTIPQMTDFVFAQVRGPSRCHQ
jgi:hypothetical protein